MSFLLQIGQNLMNFFSNIHLPPEVKILQRVETPYNNILVVQNKSIRELWFLQNNEFFLQSKMNIKQPESLVLVYSQLLMASLLFVPHPKNILVIGLGGGVLPITLNTLYPESHIDVVEIDSKITELCKKYFNLKESENLRVHTNDGRLFLKERDKNYCYDLVILDAFKSGWVPFHLKTFEFYKEINNALTPEGLVSSNLYGKSNKLKPRDLKTFSKVFKHIYLVEDPNEVATVLIANNGEKRLDKETLRAKGLNLKKEKQIPYALDLLPELMVEAKYQDSSARELNDNFASHEFSRIVKENNDNTGKRKPYPIRSSS